MFPGVKVHGEELVDRKIKIWWPNDKTFYEGTVTSFDHATKKHKVTYTDGEIEILNLKKERWEFVHEEGCNSDVNAPRHTDHQIHHPTPVQTDSCNQNSPEISSTSRVINACSETVDVNGYKVKASAAPVLKNIFEQHGDIAANCLFKSASVRASLLEIVCDLYEMFVSRNSAVSAVNSADMEAAVAGILDVEAAKIDTSWMHCHVNTEFGDRLFCLKGAKRSACNSKTASEKDVEQRLEQLVEAQEKLKEAVECDKRNERTIQSFDSEIRNYVTDWKKKQLGSNMGEGCLETKAIKRSSRIAEKKRGAAAGAGKANTNRASPKKKSNVGLGEQHLNG